MATRPEAEVNERAARLTAELADFEPRIGSLDGKAATDGWSNSRMSGVKQITDHTLITRVDEIIELDDNPALRNLLITQCYYELSEELAEILGHSNCNWCTFATWASKTAGRFIRQEEFPAGFRGILGIGDSDGKTGPSKDTLSTPSANMLEILDLPQLIINYVSQLITQGNLKVFAELGPIFARMVSIYRDCEQPDSERLDMLLEPIRIGPTQEGGQSLLRQALTHWHNAIVTEDPDRKAELILLGNARVGLHEQVRLQPCIEGSLNAPYRSFAKTFGVPKAWESSALEQVVKPAVDKICTLWREIATKEMMTLRLSQSELYLGSDLPVIPGKPLFPEYLQTIEDPELHELLCEYGAHDSTSVGSGATDWAYLPERMGYILELFRSRQCEITLRDSPFTDDQLVEILDGRVPKSEHL